MQRGSWEPGFPNQYHYQNGQEWHEVYRFCLSTGSSFRSQLCSGAGRSPDHHDQGQAAGRADTLQPPRFSQALSLQAVPLAPWPLSPPLSPPQARPVAPSWTAGSATPPPPHPQPVPQPLLRPEARSELPKPHIWLPPYNLCATQPSLICGSLSLRTFSNPFHTC